MFNNKYPIIASILPIRNVCVAGGAAAWALGDQSVVTGDVDLFVYGIDPANRAALWGKVAEVAAKLRAAVMSYDESAVDCLTETLTPGLVTFSAVIFHGSQTEVVLKTQIILRAYPSIGRILHGFDVPSCCVAYDGRRAYMTYLAAWAHTFHANIVCPRYRSTTYEARLIKYFKRGYALVFPNLCRSAMQAPAQRLPHLDLQLLSVRGLFAFGAVQLHANQNAPVSDYDTEDVASFQIDVYNYNAFLDIIPARLNFKAFNNGQSHRFMVRSATMAGRHPTASPNRSGIAFDKFTHKEPTFSEILIRASVEDMLTQAASKSVTMNNQIDTKKLINVFKLTDIEIAKLAQCVAGAFIQAPGCRIDATPALARFRAARLRAYDSMPADVGWWITSHPSRQYTASLNPRCETTLEWYGEAAHSASATVATADEVIGGLHHMFEERYSTAGCVPVYDNGTCALCLVPLSPGDPNCLVTSCGHVFHWNTCKFGKSEGCRGVLGWILEHKTCPVCRGNLEDDAQAGRARVKPEPLSARPVCPVDVDW